MLKHISVGTIYNWISFGSVQDTYRQFPVNQQGLGLNSLDVIHFKELESLGVRGDSFVSERLIQSSK